MYNFYMKLKALREENGYNQIQVAQYLNVKQNTYSQYENGHRQLPVEMLIRLAIYFHTSADYILGLTDDRHPYTRSVGVIMPRKK
jgi:transcriptional regulator with XRE-family HTH domain